MCFFGVWFVDVAVVLGGWLSVFGAPAANHRPTNHLPQPNHQHPINNNANHLTSTNECGWLPSVGRLVGLRLTGFLFAVVCGGGRGVVGGVC